MVRIITPFYKQDTNYTCGPVALQTALSFLGDFRSEWVLAKKAHTTKRLGTKHKDMITAASKEGFFVYVNSDSSLDEIRHFLGKRLPIIVHFTEPSTDDSHYAVIVGISGRKVIFNDSWNGKSFKMDINSFLSRWYDEEFGSKRWMMVIAKEDFHLGKQYLPY